MRASAPWSSVRPSPTTRASTPAGLKSLEKPEKMRQAVTLLLEVRTKKLDSFLTNILFVFCLTTSFFWIDDDPLPWPTCASQVSQFAEISDVHLLHHDSYYSSGLDRGRWTRQYRIFSVHHAHMYVTERSRSCIGMFDFVEDWKLRCNSALSYFFVQ